MVKRPRQNTHLWGFQGFGIGRYFASDFCHTVQRMNFELVFGCGAMFCPASFFTFAPPYTKPPMDKDLYHELGTLTKRKEDWKDNIPFVGSLLENQSTRIMAKALWLLGEMGLQYPKEIKR